MWAVGVLECDNLLWVVEALNVTVECGLWEFTHCGGVVKAVGATAVCWHIGDLTVGALSWDSEM